ncbi:peptidase M15 [Saccharibacillus sp. O23]|uniref:M15 family metallopeptidase n=1 Tax=Saccharibacillus sp. O23 TaxID=2009338 RepID=UPI000B4E44BD|nr:M15 family metallopeptidase [Saccharibacillus sp. O23]OWR27749.1 peptidase M15 [Saccharibacillus sp. O23]
MKKHKVTKWSAIVLGTALATGLLSACGAAGASQEPPKESQKPAEGDAAQTDPAASPFAASSMQSTIEEKDGKNVVTNPTSMQVVVNKQRYLPDGYEPSDLVVPEVPFSFGGVIEKSHMRKEAADALETLFAGAKEQGIELYAVSGYRSYKRQKSIFANNVAKHGEAEAAKVSAPPGTSEHQTGLAMDVSALSANNELEQSFGDTKEGQWLAEHAQEYGFIVHYLKGKEDKTGYSYEPWHIRYVGKELAQAVYDSGLSLDEYLDEANLSGK